MSHFNLVYNNKPKHLTSKQLDYSYQYVYLCKIIENLKKNNFSKKKLTKLFIFYTFY